MEMEGKQMKHRALTAAVTAGLMAVPTAAMADTKSSASIVNPRASAKSYRFGGNHAFRDHFARLFGRGNPHGDKWGGGRPGKGHGDWGGHHPEDGKSRGC